MTSATLSKPTVPNPLVRDKFRPDIQGLRAVAVGLVLLYHAGAPFFPGGFVGVDVFFVISGFLITGLLMRQSLEHGKIDLADFYARRMRRILPAATVVLLFTTAATLVVLPRTRWGDIGHEIVGSALYYANWLFAANTDYLDADEPPSPLQHFWTLAVEEQFYIVWPLVLVLMLFLVRRLASISALPQSPLLNQTRTRRAAEFGLLLIVLPSLAWSIYYTAANPSPAYFVTTTRLWELGIGAAIAVYAAHLQRMPARIGYVLQSAGLLGILAAGFFYTAATPFPGAAALLPTLGAAAVIIGGMSGRATHGAGKLLSIRPMKWVGDLSYSLYLWHWPLLIISTEILDDELRLRYGLLIVALAFIPSWLSYHYVERPIRDRTYLKAKPARTLRAGVAYMLISVLAGTIVLASAGRIPLVGQSSPELSDGESAGASLLAEDPATGRVLDHIESFTPDPATAADDNPELYDEGCHQEQAQDEINACVFGDPDSDYVVALAGDSHAAQWLPALEPIAEENGWRLETYTKSSCPLNSSSISIDGSLYEECSTWNEGMLEQLTGADAPDHIIVSASRYSTAEDAQSSEGASTVEEGFTQTWDTLEDAGVSVTVILDTPRAGLDIPECVAENPEALSDCAFNRDDAIDNSGYPSLSRASESSGVSSIDLTDMICPEEQCAPIVGSVLVYQDTNHITGTYSATLSSSLESALMDETVLRFSE